MPKSPIGRFAPSPTGRLHLGSLVTAVASFCHIKSLGGKWLVRLEDTDTERCKAQYRQSILDDLQRLHLFWDDSVLIQSQHIHTYQKYQQQLHQSYHTYFCNCTRKQLSNHPIYPRYCLHQHTNSDGKVRLILPDIAFGFWDYLQGMTWQNPQKLLGDTVICRQNHIINYIFSCAIDDGLQNISHVMRGLDILPMTTTQLYIQKLLGLPSPRYFYHLPLVL